MQIGAADADGGHPDQHLAGPRLAQLDRANLERPPRLPEEGGPRPHRGAVTPLLTPAFITADELVTWETFWSA